METGSPSTTITVRDILEMNSDDLKKIITDLGDDPRGMSKSGMQDLLIQKQYQSVEPPVSNVKEEIPGMPSFIASLSAEVQFQWWVKNHEETACQIEREKELGVELAKLEAEERKREAKDTALQKERYLELAKLDAEERKGEAAHQAELKLREVEKETRLGLANIELQKQKTRISNI